MNNNKTYKYHGQEQEMPFFLERYKFYKKHSIQKFTRLYKAINLYQKSNSFKDKKVLDLGCNFGYWSTIINQLGADVLGIDLSKDMIDIATDFKNSIECNKDKLSFKEMDFLSKELPSNHFDLIYFMEVIEHVDNPVDFLKEIMRVLKPGGNLIISTPNAVNTFSILKQMWPNIKGLFKDIESEPLNTGTHIDHIYDWNPYAFYRLLYRNGFKYVEHDFITLEIPYICQIPLTNIPILSRFSRGMIFNVSKQVK